MDTSSKLYSKERSPPVCAKTLFSSKEAWSLPSATQHSPLVLVGVPRNLEPAVLHRSTAL